jgi:hypothetical protein
MKWRKWNNLIHRDIGYLCVGLTMIYAISGVAVNHVRDWNPNFKVDQHEVQIGPIPREIRDREEVVGFITNQLDETEPKSHFRPDPETIEIFYEGNTARVNLETGLAVQERVQSRPLLRPMNYLHLNNPKKLWTYFADLYAICLFVLCVTGMFVLRGKKGLKGRGKWLVAAGFLVPIIFLIAYYE